MNVREDSVACSWVEGEPIPPGDFSPGHKPQKPIYPKKKKKKKKERNQFPCTGTQHSYL